MIDLMQERSGSSNELTYRLRQQELVAGVGLFALGEPDLDVCLTEACRVASSGLGTMFAKVLTFREATQDFLLSHGVGWHEGVVGHTILGADLASPAGYALRTKLPIVSNHLGTEHRFRLPVVLAEHGVERSINVIIEGKAGRPFGVLEADGTDRIEFTQHDIAFIQALANVLTAAVDRHRRSGEQVELLRQKDLLMQEVHHRVKNSLQLVQTMLHLQARGLASEEARGVLREAAGRIMTIAAVHRRLHEDGAIEQIDAGAYLKGLITDLAESLSFDPVTRPFDIEVGTMALPAEHVTPLGLITAELVTNALKYGAGRVRVHVERTPDGVVITVEDEGPGFKPGFNPAQNATLGMRLIVALAKTANPLEIDRSVPFARVRVRVDFV